MTRSINGRQRALRCYHELTRFFEPAAQGDLTRVLQSIATLRRAVAVAATSGKIVPLEADLARIHR